MRRGPACALLVALAVSAAAPMRSARADEKSEQAQKKAAAQRLFSQGLKRAEAGDSRGALTAFRSAYESYANFRVLYNIGQLCSRLGDSVCAVRSYEQYLRDGAGDVPAKRRAEVESELQELYGTLKVGAGETATVDLEPPKEPTKPEVATPGMTPDAAAPPPTEASHRPVPVALWVATGIFAAGTIVTGIVTSSKYSSFQELRDGFPVTRSALDDAQSSARTLFVLTGVLGTVTVVTAAVATYFTFAAPAKMQVGIGPGSIAIAGTWR